jgi:hypothetical protein
MRRWSESLRRRTAEWFGLTVAAYVAIVIGPPVQTAGRHVWVGWVAVALMIYLIVSAVLLVPRLPIPRDIAPAVRWSYASGPMVIGAIAGIFGEVWSVTLVGLVVSIGLLGLTALGIRSGDL